MKIRTCAHIKTNGIICGSPALRDQKFCHFHDQHEQRDNLRRKVGFPFDPTIHINTIEDPESVQVAILEIIHAILDRRLDTRRSKAVLYALQLAQNNFKYIDSEPDTERMTTGLPQPIMKPFPEKFAEYQAEWPCREEDPEPRRKPAQRATPPHFNSTFTANAPVFPAVRNDVPSPTTPTSNSASAAPTSASAAAGAPVSDALGKAGNVTSPSTATIKSITGSKSTDIPAHIQRDIDAAVAGDLKAAKRLMAYLPKGMFHRT